MSEVVSFIVFHIHSFQVTFREAIERPNRNQEYVFTRVKCFPLFSLLLAINATAFNYLSLDAEGAEIQVPIFIDCLSLCTICALFESTDSSINLTFVSRTPGDLLCALHSVRQ